MFRLSNYLREIDQPAPTGEVRQPPGPVVIWNLIRRCNLVCKHCYSISGDVDFPGELTTEDVFRVMNDLKMFRVLVLALVAVFSIVTLVATALSVTRAVMSTGPS